jgi:hypothetical protein
VLDTHAPIPQILVLSLVVWVLLALKTAIVSPKTTVLLNAEIMSAITKNILDMLVMLVPKTKIVVVTNMMNPLAQVVNVLVLLLVAIALLLLLVFLDLSVTVLPIIVKNLKSKENSVVIATMLVLSHFCAVEKNVSRLLVFLLVENVKVALTAISD